MKYKLAKILAWLIDSFEGIICNEVNNANRRLGTKQEHTEPEIALKKNADSQKNRRWN
jgi:hypothetical protein